MLRFFEITSFLLGLASLSPVVGQESNSSPSTKCERETIALIVEGAPTPTADPKLLAAVRRIEQLGGTFEFDEAGNLVGVDLSSDRISAADSDLPHLLVLPNLQHLKLSGSGITNVGLLNVCSISGLTKLALLDAQIDDGGAEQLLRLQRLTELSIRRSPALTDKLLEVVRQMPVLTHLGLLEVGITDTGLELLKEMKQLRLVDVRGCSQIGKAGLRHLLELTHLRALRLAGYQIDDECLGIVKELTGLKSLTIERAAISDDGLKQLSSLALEEISFSRCLGITDQAIRNLEAFSELKSLSVRGIPITGTDLQRLSKLNKLAILRLNEVAIGDKVVEDLCKIKSLRQLELRQTMLTNSAIEGLGSMLRLERLDVRQTSISAEGGKRLQLLLQNCKVVH